MERPVMLDINFHIKAKEPIIEKFVNLTFTELRVLFMLSDNWCALYDNLCDMECREEVKPV